MLFLRIFVDYGIVFDIVGKGIVSVISMIEVVKLVVKYVLNFKNIK